MLICTYDAIVVGSGAAGFAAACRLKEEGVSVCIVTEGKNAGTSRNTGSDKQTYYKLGLGGPERDSVRTMAQDLFNGGCTDGDTALCEAALSPRAFLSLCEMGVPFPTNRYGEYIGYKTDHDPYARATSAGPLTSKFMTEALEKKAKEMGIVLMDSMLVVRLLRTEEKVCGLLALDTSLMRFTAFRCRDLILATGGPAGIYADSVYPEGHTGATALALEIGAEASNLTEWQFGLSSVSPRWNVSGSYMQVLPRFVSVDENGTEHEFLAEHFAAAEDALSTVFLKGYQWPFDSAKALKGSSVIDLLVYRERIIRKRRVFLDYTKNPFGLEKIPFEALSEEAYTYLKKAEVLFGTPIQRLEAMNRPALELYEKKGVDLRRDYLEIALCAQHHNGGIGVDLWWQSSVPSLFAVGECAGTHGVTRPGGAALNAGQVGALRAAAYVSAHPSELPGDCEFRILLQKEAELLRKETEQILHKKENVKEEIQRARRRMSDLAGAIRSEASMEQALKETEDTLRNLPQRIGICERSTLPLYFKLKDLLTVQCAVLTAMLHHGKTGAGSRGSALYYDAQGNLPEGMEECFRFSEENPEARELVQRVVLKDGAFTASYRRVRPLPEDEDFFEKVWEGYRKSRNID